MKSKDFKILVDRLEKENEKHSEDIRGVENGAEPFVKNQVKIHKDYIDYHDEIIRFIKRLDKEIEEAKQC